MINLKTTENSIKLLTKGKFCDDDINVTFEGGSSEEYPNEAVKYYKQNRNKNYPYFPLPSEMEETQDTIYMLYNASGYMCCPVFYITFTECVCTIQKYMNTTLVSESVEGVTSFTTKYLQFSEEDSDYSTYNYIVIKLQGNITKHHLNFNPKFNGVSYSNNSSSELIEVSGNCAGCDIIVVNSNNYRLYQNLEYYSFLGVTTTNMNNMFYYCSSLQAIPQLDTSNVTDMNNMFVNCYSLQTIPQLDTSNVTNMGNMFSGCRLLCKLDIINMKLSFKLDNSTMLSQSELVKILNNLATVETTQTLTLGRTLLAKLTNEQKAIAQNKNWTLA